MFSARLRNLWWDPLFHPQCFASQQRNLIYKGRRERKTTFVTTKMRLNLPGLNKLPWRQYEAVQSSTAVDLKFRHQDTPVGTEPGG